MRICLSKFHLAHHVTLDTFDVSRGACRAVLFDKLNTAKVHVERVESWRDERIGIWAYIGGLELWPRLNYSLVCDAQHRRGEACGMILTLSFVGFALLRTVYGLCLKQAW